MATPARIAYSNLLTASGVTITSSADATGYPSSNLSHPARWKKWRSSTTNGDQWVKFDLGANKTMQLLALTDVTVHTGGGTLKFQANTADAWVTPVVDHTIAIPSPDLTHVLADWLWAALSLRWVRFYFTNVGASTSYVEVGAAFAGPYFESGKSIAPGVAVTRHDASIQRYAVGGQRSTVVRPKYHQIEGTFALQSATDRDNWRQAFDTNGVGVPSVFGLVPGTASLTFYGVFAPDLRAQHRAKSVDYWDVPFSFTEDVS